jgi:type 1 glutamine amidotransferase
VTEGLSDFTILDETYKDLWISPKVDVLLTTDHPKSDSAVAWAAATPSSVEPRR